MKNIKINQRESGARRGTRRGAVIAESAVVLGVFLIILFGMFDLGLAVMRQNTLSEAVRLLARTAIVHGFLSGKSSGGSSVAWGPGKVTSTADDSSDAATAVRPMLVAMDPGAVNLTLEWIDGDNQSGQRVRATLSYQNRPLVPFVMGTSPINLSATSTMRIAH